MNDTDLNLTPTDRELLIDLAYKTLHNHFKGVKTDLPKKVSPLLHKKLGVFVTLTIGGELRGCIGYVKGVRPLLEAIVEMAEAAAFRDPRFKPVNEEEMEFIDIEISILSPLQTVKSVDEIEIGKHGLIISRGYQSGLLLPQVATEYGWDRDTFLEHTCRKAGLPANAWQDKSTEIQKFSAEIFSSATD